MPSWNELLTSFEAIPDSQKAQWLNAKQTQALQAIGRLRGGRNVIFYASAFLQKPQAPAPNIQITHEELNGFMSVMHGMAWDRGLTLLLHTPGGVTNAAETLVSYLRSKFGCIEVIVPTFSMSAGTMISLAADRIIMGRQSQLGPIDPQFIFGAGVLSARAIVDQFEQAKREIQGDLKLAHVWAPVLQSIGPALLQEARNALDYGERMVSSWLEKFMFSDQPNSTQLAQAVAAHFNDAASHKSHGRRIDRDEARAQHVVVEDLEDNQELQDQVLTSYHLMTIAFEKGPATKALSTDAGRAYVKNWAQGLVQVQVPVATPTQSA